MVKASPEALEQLRHSTAHILAQAVLALFPEAKLAIGDRKSTRLNSSH